MICLILSSSIISVNTVAELYFPFKINIEIPPRYLLIILYQNLEKISYKKCCECKLDVLYHKNILNASLNEIGIETYVLCLFDIILNL